MQASWHLLSVRFDSPRNDLHAGATRRLLGYHEVRFSTLGLLVPDDGAFVILRLGVLAAILEATVPAINEQELVLANHQAAVRALIDVDCVARVHDSQVSGPI